jgi:hypothetical protein
MLHYTAGNLSSADRHLLSTARFARLRPIVDVLGHARWQAWLCSVAAWRESLCGT